MFKYKEMLLSRRIFENPILHLHLRCFHLYGYVASKDQFRPWLSLARCIFLTGSVWLSCVLMLTRVFQGYDSLKDRVLCLATAVLYFSMSAITLNALVQRKRE
ncbi:odorant receptor 56a-like [Drosophila madeirensis]|uniref:Odorant receptor 56a-like n=1 Tax=Drosophila madeirensis TaxID=30013 RepID=A0AAU9G6M6_DROMD